MKFSLRQHHLDARVEQSIADDNMFSKPLHQGAKCLHLSDEVDCLPEILQNQLEPPPAAGSWPPAAPAANVAANGGLSSDNIEEFIEIGKNDFHAAALIQRRHVAAPATPLALLGP